MNIFRLESFYIAALNTKKIQEIPVTEELDDEQIQGGKTRFSPSGNWLVMGNYYWNLKKKERNHFVTDCTLNATFSTDESRLITGCRDGTVKLWSLTSGQEVLILDQAHNSNVEVMILPNNNKYLLTASNSDVKLWRTGF